MMKAPPTVSIGSVAGEPALISVNKCPDAPLPKQVLRFLTLALSAEGQAEFGRVPGFRPLDAESVAAELAKLDGNLAPL